MKATTHRSQPKVFVAHVGYVSRLVKARSARPYFNAYALACAGPPIVQTSNSHSHL